ncbi:MAG: hypothetical protein ACRD0K_14330 [Egibacteraceae bacterium]
MSASLDVHTEDLRDAPAERMEIRELASIVTKVLPEDGLDRMTTRRLEEFMTPVALTAHL